MSVVLPGKCKRCRRRVWLRTPESVNGYALFWRWCDKAGNVHDCPKAKR